jgi:hypothetical protein
MISATTRPIKRINLLRGNILRIAAAFHETTRNAHHSNIQTEEAHTSQKNLADKNNACALSSTTQFRSQGKKKHNKRMYPQRDRARIARE